MDNRFFTEPIRNSPCEYPREHWELDAQGQPTQRIIEGPPPRGVAESGAGDETIREIAGHVSKRMLKHYSHIRMEAKRKALEAIVPKPRIN
jgi:hypothetical protein